MFQPFTALVRLAVPMVAQRYHCPLDGKMPSIFLTMMITGIDVPSTSPTNAQILSFCTEGNNSIHLRTRNRDNEFSGKVLLRLQPRGAPSHF
jgi:hypothetical protein